MRWPKVRGRYLFREVNERGYDLPLASVTRHGGVEFRSDLEIEVWNPSSNTSHYKRAKPRDFVIGLRSFQSGIGYSTIEGLVSPAYTVLRPVSPAVYEPFFKHLFKSDIYISRLENVAQGIRQGRTISTEDFYNIPVSVPTVAEQRAIADYLDIETGRIDALISKKRRMIEILEERVGSVIDEMLLAEGYVGKEPDDPLDGVWEKLPAGWHVMPVKHLVSHLNSGAWGGEPGENEIEMPVTTTAQISSDGQFDVCGMARRSFSKPEVAKFACRPGDIVVVKSSGSATNIISGKAGLVGDDDKTFVFSNFLMNLRPNRDMVEPRYLYMCLISTLTRERIKRMVSATTYPNLRVEEYLSSTLPVPPVVEQHRLVEEVGTQISEMRHLSSLTRKSLDLLTERRQALITEAVTGQWAVPGVAA